MKKTVWLIVGLFVWVIQCTASFAQEEWSIETVENLKQFGMSFIECLLICFKQLVGDVIK